MSEYFKIIFNGAELIFGENKSNIKRNKALDAKKEIRIVDDQINNPTFIDDLVQGINKVVELRKEGIYNIGGDEFLSRYDFTIMIAEFFKLDKSLLYLINISLILFLTSFLSSPK